MTPCAPNAIEPSRSVRSGTNGVRLSALMTLTPAAMMKRTTSILTTVIVLMKTLPKRTPTSSTTTLSAWIAAARMLPYFMLRKWTSASGWSIMIQDSTLSAQLRATPAPDTAYSSVRSQPAITAGSSPSAW
ncbi:hypothetical protein PybrP1_003978 [[Pythium] brassicae (nom. inval.)]|nr:hypothetical protein PybrP1_003978 [[Pythium] brassicae (nom. inval.)]